MSDRIRYDAPPVFAGPLRAVRARVARSVYARRSSSDAPMKQHSVNRNAAQAIAPQ